MFRAIAQYALYLDDILHLAQMVKLDSWRDLDFGRHVRWGAASTSISKQPNLEAVVAGLALLGIILPGVIKALKLDETISAYEKAAANFKVVEGALRRAADVWSNKSYEEFEREARKALDALDNAR